MNWNKTALALIIILLLINIFLGSMLFSAYNEAKILDRELIDEAVENLAQNGITFNNGVIDDNIYTNPVYTYTAKSLFAESMQENANELFPCAVEAMLFLSDTDRDNADTNIRYFDIPGGLSASVFDNSGKLLGTAIIEDDFSFEYYTDGFEPSLLTSSLTKNTDLQSKTLSSRESAAIKKFFKALYGSGDTSYKPISAVSHKDGTVAEYLITLNETELHDMTVRFYLEKSEILYVSGDIFFSKPAVSYGNKLLDGVNILYSLMNITDGDISVISEKFIYTRMKYDDGEYYIVPSWMITYKASDGEIQNVILNALTGGKVE